MGLNYATLDTSMPLLVQQLQLQLLLLPAAAAAGLLLLRLLLQSGPRDVAQSVLRFGGFHALPSLAKA